MALARGVLFALLTVAIGWAVAELSIDRLIPRYFKPAHHSILLTAWMFASAATGFAVGAWIDPRRLTEKLGWTGWGAAIGLGALTIITQLPLALIPAAATWKFVVPGLSTRINLEEAGFLSIPAALVVGGLLGWRLFRANELAADQRKNLDDHIRSAE